MKPGVCALLLLALAAADARSAQLNVGSKRFTESYILGELVAQQARSAGEAEVAHRQGLGNTAIVVGALRSGSIDIYADYTGTIAREILGLDAVPPLPALNEALAPMGLAAAVPLGFNNSYALAMRGDRAHALHVARLTDLASHPALRYGLSQEFLGRADGWPGLARAYGLQAIPRGLDHGLAYEAIAQDQVDVVDIYATDAKIAKYELLVLDDDRHYFPRYDAVLLYRADLPARLPRTWTALTRLENRIDEASMRRMNAAAELEGRDFAHVAADFLGQGAGPRHGDVSLWSKMFGGDFGRLTAQHLTLVFLSLLASIAVGVPLGVVAAKWARSEGPILGLTGMAQTIPSLALLAFLIPVTGQIGALPAFIALALYGLLPIVRNTHAGLRGVPRAMSEAARSLGLPPGATLRLVELPLALPTLMAGIKTSAVINVGTATIAAFIGAGGYGERIVTGLALNDNTTLLAGALPAAGLALLIELGFRAGERWWVPRGLLTARN